MRTAKAEEWLARLVRTEKMLLEVRERLLREGVLVDR